MMLVPAGRQPLELTTMSELDTAMSNVINNKNLTTLEKINIYSQILKKNLKLEEKFKEKLSNIPESSKFQAETNSVSVKEEDESVKKEEENVKEENVIKENQEVFVSPELLPVTLDYASAVKSIKSVKSSEPKQTVKSTEAKQIKNFLKKTKEIKKTPQQNFKWESLEDAPKLTRVRKVLNFDHKYPKDKYTNVGETYSPDNIEYDEDGNEYIKTNKRKLKKI